MRVHESSETVREQEEHPTSQVVRRVEIERGRAGYGFTIAGQAPCLLSGILNGSPACTVGLRPGDYVLCVNGRDVSEASHETVVELIGSSSQSLCLLVMSGGRQAVDFSLSDEELTFQGKQKPTWLNPGKTDSDISQRYEKDMLLMQSVGSFDAVFDISGQASNSTQSKKQRPLSEPNMSYWTQQGYSKCQPYLFGQEEPSHVASKDSVFSELQNQYDILPDSSALNVGMVVGYISSKDLDLVTSDSGEDTLRAIRDCISQIGIERKTHSLVMMRIRCNCVQLCDKDTVLAAYPAENLALCVVCAEDTRFFCLVTVDRTKTDKIKAEESSCLKTLCHVFFVDPELCDHKEHKSITDHFDFFCTPDPDTQGCLEFPRTPFSILHFVSVLYTDLGDYIEKLRLKIDCEDSDEGQSSTRNSGSGDSGIGNVSPEDQESFGDQWSVVSPNHSYHLWGKPLCISQQNNKVALKPDPRHLLEEPLPGPALPTTPQVAASTKPEAAGYQYLPPLSRVEQTDLCDDAAKRRGSQRWSSVGIRARWQKFRPNSIESLADGDTSDPKVKSNTLPPAMEQIPTMRYRRADDLMYPQRPLLDFTWNIFSSGSKNKEENKSSGLWALTRGRSSGRRMSTRTKRLSLARSLDDLETAASDGGVMKRNDCGSLNSLQSSGSLSSVANHHFSPDRRVASWGFSFERLLQDPVGVRYFSEFLKKEFSEENIMFWHACELFSQVPEHDKKQLSQKAREIYNSFLSSKATTPVNIDSQAQLADDVLTKPRPDMFKQPQLQIFNLMKFDSYARFLKSSLYQECMLAEVEGRPLPDPYQVPCSPAPSRHSYNSDHSTFTTPRKETRKPRTGKSSEDLREDNDRKAGLFSWYRHRSFGKGPRKREITDLNYNSNGRRESQESLSSGTSQDLTAPCSTMRNECDLKSSTCERERVSRSCTVALPDGSSYCLALRRGASIRQVLLELCQKQHINLAAVDLFLAGGEKPLVLDQDSMTLSCRDVRLEKRTLFRLDLVPINRSVGLKAKPTKPVAEVLRPVVAKYDLRLSDLVARISGEIDALDLGLPISNLDGLRVVLERADPSCSKEKSKPVSSKSRGPSPVRKGQLTLGDRKSTGKSVKGDGRVKLPITERSQTNKIRLDEAEEFFELLSRAQSSRADDQRGLLRKEDLVLPDFLRLTPESSVPPACSTPTSQKPGHAPGHAPPVTSNGTPHRPRPDAVPFVPPLSPILPPAGPKGEDGEGMGDLTLVGEGDITSPNSTLLPPAPSSPNPHEGSLPEANFTPPAPCTHSQPSSGANNGRDVSTAGSHQQEVVCSRPPPHEGWGALDRRPGVSGVSLEDSFEGYVAELRQCQSKMRSGSQSRSPTRPNSTLVDISTNNGIQYKATFV